MTTEEEVVERLKQVVDPHTGIDVHTMGLIRKIEIGDEEIRVTFTPTSPFCPLGIQLAQMMQKALKGLGLRPIIILQGHIQEKEINAALEKAAREC